MKRSKFTKVMAVVMSLVLLVSAVSVSSYLFTQDDVVSAEIENANASQYVAPVKDELNEKQQNVLLKAADTLVESMENNVEDMTVTETAVVAGKEQDLTSLGGIVKALLSVRTVLELKYIGMACLENIFVGLLGGISNMIKAPSNLLGVDEFESKDFYEGTETFLDAPAKDAKWSLGYSQASLVPDDINSRNYYLGGYLMQQLGGNKVEDVIDDMKVRIIAMNDNSGRGTAIFATIDCIGISNKDIRVIRNKLADYAKENNIVSINVFSTHCHSSIDTQGLWNPLLPTVLNNGFVKFTGKGEYIFLVCAGQTDSACLNGFRAFCLAAEHQHRLTKRRSLLLQAAGVGHDHITSGHQIVHLISQQWFD